MIDPAVKKSYEERFSIIRTLTPEALVPERQQMELTLKDIGAGAFFSFEGQSFYVKETAVYEETSENFKTRQGYTVTELTCLCLETGETIWFEWEYDDELEISLTQERISFRQLTDEDGESIDEDDLDQIADDQDVVVYKGEKFWYEDDWAAIYERGGQEEKLFVYEFENEAGNRYLSIEEWQGSVREEYQIYTSRPVAPGAVNIIAAKTEGK